jgi:hypothetical protein
MSSWCTRCFRIHGEGCKPSYRDPDSGEELCAFCIDGFLCPTQKRILAKARAAGVKSDPDRALPIFQNFEETMERAITTTEARICSEPGCDKKLVHNNKTGKCQAHSADLPHRPRQPANGGNGYADHQPNGHDAGIEARVALVMDKIPLAERLAFISRWLAGEA